MMTKRYAPWLRKALRIKDEADEFWTRNALSQGEAGDSDAPVQSRVIEPTDGDSTQQASVWDAVMADNAASVKQHLEQTPALAFQRREGTNVCSGGGGVTLLHEAATSASVHVVRLLLHHIETNCTAETLHAYVDATDTVGSKTTPLIAACRGGTGNAQSRLRTVQLLIAAGADVEHQDSHGDNAIHWCAHNSNNVLLRWLLKATDAGANAVFAENAKREKPLDIAKRALTRATSNRFSAHNVYNSLRSVDRKCNLRLKMQVIKRQMASVQKEREVAAEAHWATAVSSAEVAIDNADRMWREAIAQAQLNATKAETAHVKNAEEVARLEAIQWLGTTDGKTYEKKQMPVATEELKSEILRGMLTKPKDMKKAAAQRASESYITQHVQVARKKALESYRKSHPSYPTDAAQLSSMLQRL